MKSRFTTTMYETTNSDGEPERLPDLGGIETEDQHTVSGDDVGGSGVLVAVTGTAAQLDTVRGASATTEVTDAEAETWRAERGLTPSVENSDRRDIEIDQMLNQFAPPDVLDTHEENKVRVIQNFDEDLSTEEQWTVFGRYDVASPEELLYTLDEAALADFVAEWGISTIPSHLDTADVARSVISNQTMGFRTLQDQEVTAMNKVAKAKGLTRASELSNNTRSDMSGSMSDRTKRLLMGNHADHSDMMAYLKGNASPPWGTSETPPAKGSPGQ